MSSKYNSFCHDVSIVEPFVEPSDLDDIEDMKRNLSNCERRTGSGKK